MFVFGNEATVVTASACLAVSYLLGALFCIAVVLLKWRVGRIVLEASVVKSWFSQSIPLGIGIVLRQTHICK